MEKGQCRSSKVGIVARVNAFPSDGPWFSAAFRCVPFRGRKAAISRGLLAPLAFGLFIAFARFGLCLAGFAGAGWAGVGWVFRDGFGGLGLAWRA